MKFKVLPEPAPSVDRIAEIQQAVPLVPDGETSCCVRVMERAGVPSQDRAKEWLTFLRALELVEETDGKYRRLSREPDPETLRAAFLDRVYLAESVITTLAASEDPLDTDAVFERLRERLPQWERLRHTDPDAVWRERIRRILEWACTFRLAERTDGAYTTV